MPTKQTIFNRVAKHLITQGKQSIDAGGHCMYRGPNNTKCAIGCLIPDKLYLPGMEHNTVYMITIFKVPAYFYEYLGFLTDLQLIHDTKSYWPNITQALEKFALNHKLKFHCI